MPVEDDLKADPEPIPLEFPDSRRRSTDLNSVLSALREKVYASLVHELRYYASKRAEFVEWFRIFDLRLLPDGPGVSRFAREILRPCAEKIFDFFSSRTVLEVTEDGHVSQREVC